MEKFEQQELKQEKDLNKMVDTGLKDLLGKDGKDTKESKAMEAKHKEDPTVFWNLFKELPENFGELSDTQKQEMLPNAMNTCLDKELSSAGIGGKEQDKASQEIVDLKAKFMTELQGKKGNMEDLMSSYFEFTKTLGEYVAAKKGFQTSAEKNTTAEKNEQQAKKESNDFVDKLKKMTQTTADQKQKEKDKDKDMVTKNEEIEKTLATETIAADLDSVFPPATGEKTK